MPPYSGANWEILFGLDLENMRQANPSCDWLQIKNQLFLSYDVLIIIFSHLSFFHDSRTPEMTRHFWSLCQYVALLEICFACYRHNRDLFLKVKIDDDFYYYCCEKIVLFDNDYFSCTLWYKIIILLHNKLKAIIM